MVNHVKRLVAVGCYCLIFFSNQAFGEVPITWSPAEWAGVGFPQNLDRKIPFSAEQKRATQAFFDQMLAAVENRKNEEEIAVYAAIMKAWHTPMAGDDYDFVSTCDFLALRAFIGTSHAPDFIRLFKQQLITHPSEFIRMSAAYHLALFGDKSSVNEVLPFLASKHESIRGMAKKTLRIMGYDVPGPWETSVPK